MARQGPVPLGLPVPATAFVGRRAESAETRRLLSGSRLLTLAGPPGVGKTRLALHTAQESGRRFRDGMGYVELGGLRDPALLAQEVARALGLHDASTRWALDGLTRHLEGRNLLLVVDNCEHLLDACALLVDSLVRTCADLRVLATSRQSLAVAGETVFRVPPLSVPAPGSLQAEAVELLLARAGSVHPGHRMTGEELESAAELCRRLEGIPLAIELAAVRLKTLSVDQVLERLDDRFAVLGEADRAAPPHQRTLRAALDWSRDLASPEQRVLWRRLSVFPSSFDLPAVEAVCAGAELDRRRVLDALDGLVDKSIVFGVEGGARDAVPLARQRARVRRRGPPWLRRGVMATQPSPRPLRVAVRRGVAAMGPARAASVVRPARGRARQSAGCPRLVHGEPGGRNRSGDGRRHVVVLGGPGAPHRRTPAAGRPARGPAAPKSRATEGALGRRVRGPDRHRRGGAAP